MKVDTELLCLHCYRRTSHTAIYRGKYINRIKCVECGIGPAGSLKKILEKHTLDAAGRCVPKPGRALEEMASDPIVFISSFPVGTMTGPVRPAGEFWEVFK